jgi:peptidoglycan/LPS O-acetylase OafA/YrhL
MSGKETRFRPDIEGLRAFAVLIVIAFHAGLRPVSGGFIGVDVFFVLSGYLIIGLLLADLEKLGHIRMVRFYARRARRLLPASALMVVATILAACFLLDPFEQDVLWKSALATVTYSSNLFFAYTSGDYFGHKLSSNPFLHTWSLAVEEQFYFVWPVLMLVLFKISRRRSILAILTALLTIASFAACVVLTRRASYLAFFLLPARVWEFSAGGLASMIPAAWLQVRPRLIILSSWVGAALLLVSAVVLHEQMSFPGWIAVLPVIGTLLALLSGVAAPGRGLGRVLNSPPLQFFGGLSYSLYLWHWPVLVLARSYYGTLTLTQVLGCLVLVFLLSFGAHSLVENPIRYHPFLLPRQGLTLALSLLVTILSGSMVLGWHHWVVHNPRAARSITAVHDIPALYARHCQVEGLNSEPEICSFSPGGRSTETVVLFGDSHAAQWFPALQVVANQRNWTIVTLLKGACAPVDVRIYSQTLHRENTECHLWYERSLEKIRFLHPSMVVISFATWYRDAANPDLLLTTDRWQQGIAHTLAVLSQSGIPIRLIRDTPISGFNVPACLAELQWTGHGTCSPMLRAKALDSHVFIAEQASARELTNVAVVDMTNQICGPLECPIERPDRILYRDENHLTAHYTMEMSPVLATYLPASGAVVTRVVASE